MKSLYNKAAAKSTGPYTATVEITNEGFKLDGWGFSELQTDWYRIIR